jgi:DNA-binding SARP family transcriptional activator
MAQAGEDARRERPVRVHLLGEFEIEGLAESELGSRKARVFLKAVALGRGRTVPADRLADIVWGAAPPAKPNDQLSVLASRLRRVLGADRIERTGSGYCLHADWLDIDEIELLADEAGQRLSSGSAAAARAAAGAALRLARGDLLADEPEAEWVEVDRRVAARLVSRLTALAAAAELDGGDPTAAAALAEQALDRDPYDEAALRLLMAAHRSAGRPASALAAYSRARERLRDDLGVSPTTETEALHAEILLTTDAPPMSGASAPASAPASPPPPVAPLPGRADELAALDDELGQALGGTSRLVVVRGESGIGKSTLLERWREGVASTGVIVLSGRCDEFSAELPLQAVVDALARYLDRLEPPEVDAVLRAEAASLAPLLGRADPSTRPAAGDTGQVMLFASLLSMLTRLATDTGLLVVIDDFQYAGDSTRDWLRYFQRRAGGARMLVVVSTRPDRSGELDPDRIIGLGPLSLAAAAEIVGAGRADELYERSGGHPLFLVELASASGDDDGPPHSIRSAVARRLRQVGPAADAIAAAAVLGPTVDLDLVAATTHRSAIDVLDDLEVGAREGFLDEQGASFVFRHALVREAVAADVSAARRAWMHREAAAVLDGREPGGDPSEITHHARLGGERGLAARALAATAALAMARYAYGEAVRSLDEAIELDDSSAARLLRGRARIVMGQFDGAMVDAQHAIELGAGAPALELAAWAAYYARDLARAEAFADEGARRSNDAAVRSSCLTVAGRVRHGEGQLAAADGRLTEAIELAGPASPGVARVWLASLRTHQSRDLEAVDLVAVSSTGERDPIAASFRHVAAAHALGHLGQPTACLARLDELDRLMAETGFRRYEGASKNWRAWILRYLGATDDAAQLSDRGAEISSATNFDEGVAHALLDRADLAMLGGDLATAAEFLDRAAPYHERNHTMRWRHALRGQLLRSHLAVMLGDDLDGAAELAGEVMATAAALGVERYRVLGGLVEAMARIGAGDEVAAADLDGLLDRVPSVAGTEAWWWTARVAATTGDDRWRQLAERRVVEISLRAGDHADSLQAFADHVLSRR